MEQLEEQRKQAIQSAKLSSLGEMAGGIAHEINNPLAIIIGKTAQLKRKMRDEGDSLKNYDAEIGVIEATSKRISAIIKGLSAFSRNAENDQMQKVLVPQLIQDTLELSKERFRFHSIDLKFNLESSDQTYVNGRASQLLQVLINLLNNAYDAVEHLPEKWVRIVVSTDNEKCIISVTDSGPGIPSNILEKIMTPFFTTKDVGKGTGLGLSISKGIIEEHHGKLYYDTTSTHTRFIIELPIA
jgi:C4-dicarboxylate-specific signal transduction histidine kinase